MNYKDLVAEAKEKFTGPPENGFSNRTLANDVGCRPEQATQIIKEWLELGRIKYHSTHIHNKIADKYYTMIE